jgi:hypothetical protein
MLDQKTNTFLVNFHWEGKRYTRSIGTDNAKIAREAQARVNHLLSRIKGGIEPTPEGVGYGRAANVAMSLRRSSAKSDLPRTTSSAGRVYRRRSA